MSELAHGLSEVAQSVSELAQGVSDVAQSVSEVAQGLSDVAQSLSEVAQRKRRGRWRKALERAGSRGLRRLAHAWSRASPAGRQRSITGPITITVGFTFTFTATITGPITITATITVTITGVWRTCALGPLSLWSATTWPHTCPS